MNTLFVKKNRYSLTTSKVLAHPVRHAYHRMGITNFITRRFNAKKLIHNSMQKKKFFGQALQFDIKNLCMIGSFDEYRYFIFLKMRLPFFAPTLALRYDKEAIASQKY